MKVVILCGGFGTRIRDVSEDLPKPMLPIGNFPILWHIMKYYSTYGHNEFVLCLGYKSHVIKDFFLNMKTRLCDFTIDLACESDLLFHDSINELDWRITFAETGLNSMTGHRLFQVKKYLDNQPFFLTYGDGVGNIDLKHLLSFHVSQGRSLTVSGVKPPGRFGELMHTDSIVTEFNEKPQATGGLISGGYFVANPSIFDYLCDDPSLVFEDSPMKTLVSEKQLAVFEHPGFWQPMDTSREYQLLNNMFSSSSAPWVRW